MNGRTRALLGAFALSVASFGGATPSHAARCGGDFDTFVQNISAEAQAAGISPNVVSSALGGVHAGRRGARLSTAASATPSTRPSSNMSRPASAPGASMAAARCCSAMPRCSRSIEARFGVPRQILVAIWGLETDFGKGDMGKLPVIRTLATLAHDCRRTELFQGELLAALKIVQRGDLPLRDLIGAFAGEIGQTQFLPSSYIKYGVDFDGDGRVDLRHSVPDVLASTANLLHTNGFKMGAPYGEGTANFEAMREWNHAVIYRKTIGYFADQLVGR